MDGYTYSELGAILAMQGFAGISLFSVLLLMALGLAIIFGQMGVINMAHGEFMAVGAYTTYFLSYLTETYFPAFMPYYFIFAIVVAFIVAGILGGKRADHIKFVCQLGQLTHGAAKMNSRDGGGNHFTHSTDS